MLHVQLLSKGLVELKVELKLDRNWALKSFVTKRNKVFLNVSYPILRVEIERLLINGP